MKADRRGFGRGLLAGLPLLSASKALAQESTERSVQKRLVYSNTLSAPADVAGWRLEGTAAIEFPDGALRIENTRPAEDGQAANIVFWSDVRMEGDVEISWEFRPLREPGLCVLLLFADGLNGRDLFDPALAPRAGIYEQYIRGDIQNIGLSYFRRRYPRERAFGLCNLRENPGFALRAQAADPLPSLEDWPADAFYSFRLRKTAGTIAFYINDFPTLQAEGDFARFDTGYLGFRQMAPLIGEYRNLTVHALL